MVSADGQDVAVAYVFVFVVIDIIYHREPFSLFVIAERTVLHQWRQYYYSYIRRPSIRLCDSSRGKETQETNKNIY